LKIIPSRQRFKYSCGCDGILDAAQETGLNANMATIVGNFTSHWGTGQALAFTASALLGVMNAIDQYCDCFTFEPSPGGVLPSCLMLTSPVSICNEITERFSPIEGVPFPA
jgi:hypothetical protein